MTVGQGKRDSASYCRATGAISARAKARTVSRTSRFCSVKKSESSMLEI